MAYGPGTSPCGTFHSSVGTTTVNNLLAMLGVTKQAINNSNVTGIGYRWFGPQ
jgi:hypothetical protein